MGLNDDVLEDLEQNNTVLDNDVVKLPQDSSAPKEAVTLTVDQSKQPSAVPDAELAKLPEMEVAIKLVEDGQEKVVQLTDVENEIIGQESISRSGAEMINASFEGFLSASVPLSHYTQSPSKTNLSHAKRFMRTNIAKEEAAIASNFELLIAQPLSDAKEMYSRLMSTYIPAIQDELIWLQSQNQELKQKLVECKDSIFPAIPDTDSLLTNEFINIAIADLVTIPDFDSPVSANFKAIRQLLKYRDLHNFVLAIKDGTSVQEAVCPEVTGKYEGYPVTIADLLDFYSMNLRFNLAALDNMAQENIKTLTGIHDEALKHMETPEQTKAFISESMPVLGESFATLGRCMSLMQRLSLLNYNSKAMFDFIRSM